MSSDDLNEQLRKSMQREVDAGLPYEASQLAISFVARKRKNLAPIVVSNLVFAGATLLIDSGYPSDAGTLVKWFIEDKAIEGNSFHVEDNEISNGKYCDIKHITDLFNDTKVSLPLLAEKIYAPIHKAIHKVNVKVDTPLHKRLELLELKFALAFESNKSWYLAYKCYLRLNDSDNAARVLSNWANDGYATEYPIFFGRAVLELLAAGYVDKASRLVVQGKTYVADKNISTENPANGVPLAIWHVAMILTELAAAEARPRVDKARIYNVLLDRYKLILSQYDMKLYSIMQKVGETLFEVYDSQRDTASNPMAFLQSMFASGNKRARKTIAPKKKEFFDSAAMRAPQMDMNAMLKMIMSMQGK